MDLSRVGLKRFLDLNEMEELRNDAYINSKIAKEKLKRWIGPFTIHQVHSNGVVELLNSNSTKSFKVNGHRLKPFVEPFSSDKEEFILLNPHQGRFQTKEQAKQFAHLAKFSQGMRNQGIISHGNPASISFRGVDTTPLQRMDPRLVFHFDMAQTRGAPSQRRTKRQRASSTQVPSDSPSQAAEAPRIPPSEGGEATGPSSHASQRKHLMVIAPPIEGNLDCRARLFHSELHFDQKAMRQQPELRDSYGLLERYHLEHFMTPQALQIPYEPKDPSAFRQWSPVAQRDMVHILSRGPPLIQSFYGRSFSLGCSSWTWCCAPTFFHYSIQYRGDKLFWMHCSVYPRASTLASTT
ncbi:hypothetical protein CK203_106530 [Vitis vinifera]|uniref:Uncharacterized protein n=1 Tax=Vitis vinifera TaxID=29760 RepID=A0A438D5Z7_VITVI|nr:hypothetical protein CK203_106530 [Vitis vinifera]